jgi:hypothetical protein
MPRIEVLELCEKLIHAQLGTMDDLPYELANTIANVYYRYCDVLLDSMQRAENNPVGWVPKEVKTCNDPISGLINFQKKVAQYTADVKIAPDVIKTLREIDKIKTPHLYDDMVDFILDNYKYNIKNVQKKIGLRRIIERKIKSSSVNEIPHLVDLLKI